MSSIPRRILAALVAALALSVIASASASAALPEFSPSRGLTGTGGSSFFQTEGFATVPQCASTASKGTLTGPKSGTLEVELKGCNTGSGFNSVKCSTTGQAAGVVLFSATIEPVYITKEPKLVGLLVNISEFTAHCGISPVAVRGSYLGSITPINKKVKTTEHFTVVAKETAGKNEYTGYENPSGEHESTTLKESIEGGPFTGAGYQSTEQLAPSVEMKLKAEAQRQCAEPARLRAHPPAHPMIATRI
jgi:hypothetical protein